MSSFSCFQSTLTEKIHFKMKKKNSLYKTMRGFYWFIKILPWFCFHHNNRNFSYQATEIKNGLCI